jgi:hypothetical protein
LAAIQEVGIKKICYSTENGYKQEIIWGS